MSEITEEIKKELLIICEESKKEGGFDIWNEHIKYVVQNAISLAKKYGADVEIVELGALLHDIAKPSKIGTNEEHHIYGAQIAEELLTKLNYPKDKIEHVKNCVLNYRGSVNKPKKTIEEQCVADADVIAHFDCISSLFHLVYHDLDLSVQEGKEYVKKKLERDYSKLSDRTRIELEDRYKKIMEVLFI